ncbi:MAG: class II aldolase/adducin family protein [Sphingomicrobium sp.]
MNRVDSINRGVSEIKPLDSIEIPSLEGKVSDEEWAIRVDLAAAYRMVAHYGWDDLIFTHLSARIPGPENHFLLNPYNLMFEEVTASSLIKVDVSGNPVDATPFITNPAGFTIHSAIHMARDDAHAVMHLHTPAGQAVSAHNDGLLPLTQTAMLIRGDVAFHDYEGVAVDLGERERLVADLGEKNAMILRNHGTLAVGKNVGECFIRLYYLERACQAQVMALSAGDQLNNPPQGSSEVTAQQGAIGLPLAANLLAWPALKRTAGRLDPAFASLSSSLREKLVGRGTIHRRVNGGGVNQRASITPPPASLVPLPSRAGEEL